MSTSPDPPSPTTPLRYRHASLTSTVKVLPSTLNFFSHASYCIQFQHQVPHHPIQVQTYLTHLYCESMFIKSIQCQPHSPTQYRPTELTSTVKVLPSIWKSVLPICAMSTPPFHHPTHVQTCVTHLYCKSTSINLEICTSNLCNVNIDIRTDFVFTQGLCQLKDFISNPFWSRAYNNKQQIKTIYNNKLKLEFILFSSFQKLTLRADFVSS